MTRRNAIFLLIDSMRFDVASDPESMRAITPNLARLAGLGFARQVVANAQSTQFVMPSLFSQSYPLDHGGYNNGIRERPASFVECLKDAGYQSHLVGASAKATRCDNDALSSGTSNSRSPCWTPFAIAVPTIFFVDDERGLRFVEL